jgi:uncharacterized caspase-like protein
LNYAVSDAKSVTATLQTLGFSADKIVVLLDREATKQRIEQALYETLAQSSPDDRLLVFFAGHGLTASLPRGGEEGYLLPVDGDPDNLPLTAISMDDVRKIARRIPAKHILFAVDACYSGFAITRDIPPTKVDALYLEAVTQEPAVQIITAGRKGEPVLEEEGHGLFTRRLMQGLTGLADIDQNGIITGQELATWLESRVIRDSKNRQHPQYSRLDGEGQFVFVVPRRQEAPVTATVDDREQKIKEELRRLADEAERLKRERAIFEGQRKLQAEREALLAEKRKLEEERRIELAKLEAERARLKAEEEPLAKARAEQARLETERKRQGERPPKAAPPQAIAKLPSPQPPPRPATVVPGVAELPKYNVGDSWTLRLYDGRTVTRKVRAIEKEQYVFEWAPDHWQYLDLELVLRKETTPAGKDWHSRLLDQRVIDFPLSVKKAWEFRVLMHRHRVGAGRQVENLEFWRIFRFKVLESETLQTPAGSFVTFKIEENSHEVQCEQACSELDNTSIVRHLWYAPEVKFPVKVRHVSGTPWEEQEPDYELISYHLK